MVFRQRYGYFFVFTLVSLRLGAQVFVPSQTRVYHIIPDTLVLDSLSLVPGSIECTAYPALDSTGMPETDYRCHALIFRGKKPDSILVYYRRFPFNFEKDHFHKDQNALYTDYTRGNPFTIKYNSHTRDNLLQNDGLDKNGNISRGITFGNNQDMVVNSNLNLQVSGKLTPDIDMVMAATDNNIPFQADGNTAQLQEFDKVYIQLSNTERYHNSKMIVGDYQLSRPQNSYFMNFYKRAQGLYLENSYRDSASKQPLIFKTQVSGAVSRGKFSRQVFFGTESNQGPYRLRGADNELFIIVLSGTERIYIDGKLLQRGQENDYIIDYNTSELTFTAKQLITKDKRIVAEFQYAERNYSRSLFFFGEEVEMNRSKVYLNFYSEQDNRNKPLLQTLSQEQKDVMIEAGDSLSRAVYSGVREEEFSNNRVYYMRIDTLYDGFIYPGVYVYSNDPEKAKYTLQFSNVGAGRGNYRQVYSSANGKVYEWIAPVNGQPQGTHEPVIPLVTPKQSQMLSGGISHRFTGNNELKVECVYTKKDINTFSRKDKGDDEGSGVKVTSRNESKLFTDTSGRQTKLIYNFDYEYLQKRFSQIERFRSIEFERDWNRPLTGILNNDQHLSGGEVGIVKSGRGGLTYGVNLFEEAGNYRGFRQLATAGFTGRDVRVSYNGSYLTTDDALNAQKSEFYRHTGLVSRRVDRVKLTFSDVLENNLFMSASDGRLLPRSYLFWEWEGSVSNADSSKNNMKLFYRERRDKLSYSNELKDSTFARSAGIQASINSIRNNPFSIMLTYRKLELKNVVGSFLKPDNTMLSRLEYNPRYLKGFITSGLFYESGFGLENKREFYYLEVAPGQGQYAWIDYNSNGVRELNEFETALFSDQARFIRVYTPTNQYVKVLQNQFSLSFNIRPSALLRDPEKGFGSFLSRWVFQNVIRWDNKLGDLPGGIQFNPFVTVHDSLLIAANRNQRQSIFFNQSSAVFSAGYTRVNNLSRQLLTNGIEQRSLVSQEINLRYNFLRAWSFTNNNTYSLRGNSSEFFFTRNYMVEAKETEQKLSYQPNTVFRLSAIYKYSNKLNVLAESGQKALVNNIGLELRYNQTEKGSITARADYVKINYNGEGNSPVAYEMLNGLNPGDNYTWELNYQRNLGNNLQVNINYNGRQSPGVRPVHLGGAQVRAFF